MLHCAPTILVPIAYSLQPTTAYSACTCHTRQRAQTDKLQRTAHVSLLSRPFHHAAVASEPQILAVLVAESTSLRRGRNREKFGSKRNFVRGLGGIRSVQLLDLDERTVDVANELRKSPKQQSFHRPAIIISRRHNSPLVLHQCQGGQKQRPLRHFGIAMG